VLSVHERGHFPASVTGRNRLSSTKFPLLLAESPPSKLFYRVASVPPNPHILNE